MDANTNNIDERKMIVAVAHGFYTARQIAYDHMQKNQFFEPWFREADATYLSYCEQVGMDPHPVFDEKAHAAMRAAEGHPDFVENSRVPDYGKPEAKPGEWELHGFVGDYSVWHDGAVYQVTKGEEPSNRAGYRSLEALLGLKGLNIRDLEPIGDIPRM